MSSEWLKVMLDEIARKKAEAAAARDETERRASSPSAPEDGSPRPGAPAPGGPGSLS
jgi:hypothetical protein